MGMNLFKAIETLELRSTPSFYWVFRTRSAFGLCSWLFGRFKNVPFSWDKGKQADGV